MKSPIHILYLEDDPEDAPIIQSALEAEGFPCATTCAQSRDGLAAALEYGGIDSILSDSALPAFEGISGLNIVRARWPVINEQKQVEAERETSIGELWEEYR